MIRHTFKLIWNRKRRNLLLIGEVFLAFIVLFVVSTALITGLLRYMKPLGFSYANTWILFTNRGGGGDDLFRKSPAEDARKTLAQIRREMEAIPEINRVSFLSSNYPYSHSTWSTGFKWAKQNIQAWVWLADDNLADVLGLKILEGRWFNREDDASPRRAIVLTKTMKEELFGDQSPIGKIQTDDDGDEERVIVGVVDDYRYKGEFETYRGGFFERHPIEDTSSNLLSMAVFSVQEGSDARVEEAILKQIQSVAPNWIFRIETLGDKRKAYMKDNFLSAGVFVTIAGFLIFNVALGLFGVLWQSISRRHGEIGLRRAIGANRSHIAGQVVVESLVLATFAILAGILVAVQVPVLRLDTTLTGMRNPLPGLTYVLAMACAALLIYLLVSLCALYPSQLAARVQPAAALHDD